MTIQMKPCPVCGVELTERDASAIHDGYQKCPRMGIMRDSARNLESIIAIDVDTPVGTVSTGPFMPPPTAGAGGIRVRDVTIFGVPVSPELASVFASELAKAFVPQIEEQLALRQRERRTLR